ncbi:MAG TPA: UDP-3-O-(3-hydroxymyristoyl)glucosamine N-acyltransferase [Gemmatimonadaceae bacterium]
MSSRASDSASPGGERACTLTARAIADLVGGELRGEEHTEVQSVAPLGRATRDQITFLGDGRYAGAFAESSAGIALVTPELADVPGRVPSRVIVAKPQAALIELLPKFYPADDRAPSIDSTARVGRGAKLGSGVSLGAYAVIGDCAVIGDGVWIGPHCVVGDGVPVGSRSRLFPHVTIYSGSQVGERVTLHAGVRIGSDGFGYVFDGGIHRKIPHVGKCIVESDVEIGANTTVDRGSIDDTVIGAGTKIDNLVQIGHNVKIGKLCLIMAQVGIAGSTTIGDGCVLAGQAGLGGHISIGPGARIAGQSGVFGNVPAGETWSGYPARPHRESLRATGALFRLSEMIKDLENLLESRKG